MEGCGCIVLCIDDQRVRCDLLSGLQASVYGAAEQQLAQSAALLIRSAGEPPHPRAGHRAARQLLALRLGEPVCIDFGCAQGVISEDGFRLHGVGQDENRTDAAATVLFGKALDVLVQQRNAAFESSPIVKCGVERRMFQHAVRCDVPGSGPA